MSVYCCASRCLFLLLALVSRSPVSISADTLCANAVLRVRSLSKRRACKARWVSAVTREEACVLQSSLSIHRRESRVCRGHDTLRLLRSGGSISCFFWWRVADNIRFMLLFVCKRFVNNLPP